MKVALAALRRWPAWAWVAAAALVAVAARAVPLTGDESVASIADRVGPILLFLVAVTVVAEVCQAAGLFDWFASIAARAGRGSTAGLFLGVAVLATACTVVLSLDTTAVLLTPVVIALCRRAGVAVVPFALLVVWLANVGSLLLPVSNLTNLLAADRLGLAPVEFAHRMLLPAAVAVVVPVAALWLLHRRDLRTRYDAPPVERVGAPAPFAASVAAVGALVVGFGLGWPVHVVASAVAVALLAVVGATRPGLLGWWMAPWRLVVMTFGLFVCVTAATRAADGLGLLPDLTDMTGLGGLMAAAFAGMAGANLVNNLPAYLALEPAVGPAAGPGHAALLALLVGVNAGATVLPHASLATLLWWDRCRAAGERVDVRRYVAFGAVVAPVTVALAVLALHLV